MVKSKQHLVHPSLEDLSRLNEIRKSNVFSRIFRGVSEGSMRLTALFFVRLCIGVGILTLPYYIKVFGGVVGVCILLLSVGVNYLMYSFLAEVGNQTGLHDFLILNRRFNPVCVQKIFKITYLLDLMSSVFFYMILAYNMFEYILTFVGILPDSWYVDDSRSSLRTYHGPVFLMRFIYNVCSLGLLLPFMFRKDLGALKTVTHVYIISMGVLCLFILVEMPFFRKSLQTNSDFHVNYVYSPPSGQWLESFFGLMSTFYAQQYFFSIRKELMNPTTKRLKKTSFISMSALFVLCLAIGESTSLLILRPRLLLLPGRLSHARPDDVIASVPRPAQMVRVYFSKLDFHIFRDVGAVDAVF